jgi:hypothetical protein
MTTSGAESRQRPQWLTIDLTDQRSRPGPVNRHRPPGGAGSRALRVRKTVADAGIVSPLTLGGTYGALVIATDDADTIWQRAFEAGAEVFHPIGDTFWGERFGQFIDPFGIAGASRHLRDVPHHEIVKAAAEAFGGTPSQEAR